MCSNIKREEYKEKSMAEPLLTLLTRRATSNRAGGVPEKQRVPRSHRVTGAVRRVPAGPGPSPCRGLRGRAAGPGAGGPRWERWERRGGSPGGRCAPHRTSPLRASPTCRCHPARRCCGAGTSSGVAGPGPGGGRNGRTRLARAAVAGALTPPQLRRGRGSPKPKPLQKCCCFCFCFF